MKILETGMTTFQFRLLIFVPGVYWVLLFFPLNSVWAWGPQGHRIVGLIADWRLSAEVKKIILEDFNIKSLAEVANWADSVRDSRSQGSWHYTNIKKGEWTYEKNRDCPHGQCVVEKIYYFSRQINDKTLSHKRRREALSYLVHFVSDAHQPLHLGYKHDRGGGKVPITFRGRKTNLHAIWDGELIAWKGKNLLQYARDLHRRVSQQDLQNWVSTNVVDWANESRKLVMTHVYAIGKNKNNTLDSDYVRKSRLIIDLRMSQAGVRLANSLNHLLPH